MTADEVKVLRDALAERYPHAPDDATILSVWTQALEQDDFNEITVALAAWWGRHPERVPTIADLRAEPRHDAAAGSAAMRLARAAYEAECARQGRRPRADLFGGAA